MAPTMLRRIAIGIVVLAALGVAVYLASRQPNDEPAKPSQYAILADHHPFEFSNPSKSTETPFRVDWPPTDPARERTETDPPLLHGKLIAIAGRDDAPQISVRIELTRGDSEVERTRWNAQLEFPEYDWMSKVRVWDDEEKWLWPNVPYLLRAHGIAREQRYGGVDPGKGVDNDFAAIVAKSLDRDMTPVITAEWHAPPVGYVDKHSVVHVAVSDDLLLTPPEPEPNSPHSGRYGVWLIYADFLGYDVPRSWPQTPEYDGGILAFFTITLRGNDDGSIDIMHIEHETPPSSTGVDWESWWTKTFDTD
jgi:hypothetical protein